MVRKNFYITREQEKFLQDIPGNISEHIRRALDAYIEKLRSRADATTSPSKSTKGGENGRSGNTYRQPSATQG